MAGIRFYINGKEHFVPLSFPATTSLNDYLRETAGLKGTKVMCKEAGCGCCAVTVTSPSPQSDQLDTYSVQSCVTPLYAADGWQISTIEGLGSQKKGFHPIQERIARFNGTQCGYCTPGVVMNMYGLLHQKPNISSQEIEENFDGNICRCTGYRAILDAMKSFAGDANIPGCKTIDIEDLNKNLVCAKSGQACTGSCSNNLDLLLPSSRWYRPTSLSELGKLMSDNKGKKVRLVLGNTSTGIYKHEGPYDVYVDLHRLKELFHLEMTSTTIKLGAATTLTQVIEKLKCEQENPGFHYLAEVCKHLKHVANAMVRNVASIGGNLMLKQRHKDFPSDVFTLLECAGAELSTYDCITGQTTTTTMLDFLAKVDMSNKVLTAVTLPRLPDNVHFRSFKVTPRWQNAHAYVNAAFKIQVDGQVIKGRPSIVLGGISHWTIHATKTEDYLTNKTLNDNVNQEACSIIKEELTPSESLLESSPQYRKDLASGLLFKVLLGLYQSTKVKAQSGSTDLHRPVSSGLQTFQEMPREFPLKKAMPKLEATIQASGEAVFINDMPRFQHELYGVLTLADVANATIDNIDATDALKVPGVTHFITAKDIIGENNFMFGGHLFQFPQNEVFSSKEVHYNGQPFGLILAESLSAANEGAKRVKVTYSEIREPVVTLDQSIEKDLEFKQHRKTVVIGDPDDALNKVDHTVEGTVKMGSQYHFYMETQVSLAVPSEDGIDLFSSTQYSDICHHAAAQIIGKPLNYVNLTVPRLGGAFGGKSFDPALLSAAAILAAYVTDRPVRLNMDLESNIRIFGKRHAFLAKYKAGFSEDGKVQVVDVDLAIDGGFNDHAHIHIEDSAGCFDGGYYVPNWHWVGRTFKTNKMSTQPARAPGAVPCALIIETIMEHVAKVLNQHPMRVKELNLYDTGLKDIYGHALQRCNLREVWRRLKDVADVESRIRQVEAFNQENTWKKRALTLTPVKHGVLYLGPGFGATVTIFCRDGSVVITTGGVEMGQGLYTKVTQGVANVLGLPLDLIKVRPMLTVTTPNSSLVGASMCSESTMQAAIIGAETLKERMRPIREKFPGLEWKNLCMKCDASGVDLSVRSFHKHETADHPLFRYHTYCAASTETEVDILTGQSSIRRLDIVADYGESLNPTIDIGQTEGAYVMGLGAMLLEDTKFDLKTGRILTDGTWNYKPPSSKDIPIDWRTHLLPDTPNPTGVRSAKACGEPAISLSTGALLANKQAVEAARQELLGQAEFLPVDAPYTPDKTQQSVGL